MNLKARLTCLVKRHQWHNDWDDFRHQTLWTCTRCGKTRYPDTPGEAHFVGPEIG